MASKKNDQAITPKQEAFALEYILNGGDASKAYRECYDASPDSKDTTIWRNAHDVLHNAKVSAKIQEHRVKQYSGDIATVQERKNILTEMVRDGNLKALDILNKMDGQYVEKVELNATQKVEYYAPKKSKEK